MNYPEALESFINRRLNPALPESSLQFADERNFLYIDITDEEAAPVLLLQFGIHDGDRRRVMGILKADWLNDRIGRIQGMVLEGKACSWPQLWGRLNLYLDLPLVRESVLVE
ncbi:hypothetical protein [Cellvibrio sp. QJXJ]|uniref:hypothetical protein n=1 Tax=Cellvibrio sp. QJXJ TaxID=2964606 RepID=UPI0021C438A9|nr:hypothetical protein [Cellvibrio sp. QJXJ]UUA75273.1 hypothetical protein NNX04_22720 [Cellvibrio sp. QJXJ]